MKPSPKHNILTQKPETEEEQKAREERDKKFFDEMQRNLEESERKKKRVDDILTQLQIPHNSSNNMVSGEQLADILMDEEKVKAILIMVRNKVFW